MRTVAFPISISGFHKKGLINHSLDDLVSFVRLEVVRSSIWSHTCPQNQLDHDCPQSPEASCESESQASGGSLLTLQPVLAKDSASASNTVLYVAYPSLRPHALITCERSLPSGLTYTVPLQASSCVPDVPWRWRSNCVHIHDHGGSEAPDGSPDSILSSEPKPLRKHRPPLPPFSYCLLESPSYPP
ncbi:hypothetical protein Tco_0128142 [Tanacetum coccineum]|uniref:Uncharacterized protein n=1 Tax=Tanacetum coccineum TaxID=301880 RepID=A0ABQ5CR96_9ASTR